VSGNIVIVSLSDHKQVKNEEESGLTGEYIAFLPFGEEGNLELGLA